MAGETSYPMTERGAYIRLYGKKARILLEDEQRRRYAVTETCRVEPLFTDEELARACGGFAIENPGLLLHLCGEQEEEMQLTAENLAWYQQAARTSAFPVLTGKQCVRNCWNIILPIRMSARPRQLLQNWRTALMQRWTVFLRSSFWCAMAVTAAPLP